LRCHAEGLLSEAETGLDLAKVGSLEFIEDLIRMTSYRRGFGELLALGAHGAARARGGGTEALFTRTDPYDPRYCTVNALLFPFETREPIQQLHEAGLVLSQWSSWAKGVEGAHISSEVARGIAERFWGSAAAADMTTYDGKAGAAKRIQDRQLAKESLGVCDWMFPLIDVPQGRDHVGDPTLEAAILSAASGVEHTQEDLARVGERVFNLQRAILLREGHRPLVDDVLPEEWHRQGIETHVADPDLLVPGPSGEVTTALGRRVDPPTFERIRDEYYELRGWDVPSGLQSRQLLRDLDLGDVADDLAARDLLAARARGVPARRRAARAVGAAVERGRTLVAALARRPGTTEAKGSSVRGEELAAILAGEVAKFNRESVRHNFAGWNKTMVYTFPDIGERWAIRFVAGEALPPERCEGKVEGAEISYEMDTWTLASMARGELGGEQAYLRRLLRIRASFADMMKLQSLNKA